MATLQIRDANGVIYYVNESSGDGSSGNPFIPSVSTSQANSQAIAVTTSGAYSAGDVVGGIISLSSVNLSTGRRVNLRSVQINDKSGNARALAVYFFKAIPSGGTYTDNSALVWGSGDSANKVGSLSVLTTSWMTDASQSSANFNSLVMKMSVAATTLFMLIVCPSGSAPTYNNGDLTVNLEFDQE